MGVGVGVSAGVGVGVGAPPPRADLLAFWRGGKSSTTEYSTSAKPLNRYQETHSELTLIIYLALH